MTTKKRTLRKIDILHILDDSPDLSWIGDYSGTRGPEDRTIDRLARSDMSRGEYRYFIACNSGEETGNPDSVEQDYQRMEAYNRGDWHVIGLRVRATIAIHECRHTRDINIESSGLWGVESDSGDDYMTEVAREQLDEIRAELNDWGIDDAAIDAAFSAVNVIDQ